MMCLFSFFFDYFSVVISFVRLLDTIYRSVTYRVRFNTGGAITQSWFGTER